MDRRTAQKYIRKLEKAGYENIQLLRDSNLKIWGVSWDGKPFGNPLQAWNIEEGGKLEEALEVNSQDQGQSSSHQKESSSVLYIRDLPRPIHNAISAEARLRGWTLAKITKEMYLAWPAKKIE